MRIFGRNRPYLWRRTTATPALLCRRISSLIMISTLQTITNQKYNSTKQMNMFIKWATNALEVSNWTPYKSIHIWTTNHCYTLTRILGISHLQLMTPQEPSNFSSRFNIATAIRILSRRHFLETILQLKQNAVLTRHKSRYRRILTKTRCLINLCSKLMWPTMRGFSVI